MGFVGVLWCPGWLLVGVWCAAIRVVSLVVASWVVCAGVPGLVDR